MNNLELVRLAEINKERGDRVAAIESIVASLEDWRPGVDGIIDDMCLEVWRLSKHWNRTVGTMPAGAPGLMTSPEWFAERSPTGTTTTWPDGHRVGRGYGVVTTLTPTQAKGTDPDPPYALPCFHGHTYENHAKP